MLAREPCQLWRRGGLDRGKNGKDSECVGEETFFFCPLRFSAWGVHIKITKDSLIEERTHSF